MKIDFNLFLLIIIIISIIQSFFLGIILFILQRINKKLNIILAFVLYTILVSIFFCVIILKKSFLTHFIKIGWILLYTNPLLIYLFVKSLKEFYRKLNLSSGNRNNKLINKTKIKNNVNDYSSQFKSNKLAIKNKNTDLTIGIFVNNFSAIYENTVLSGIEKFSKENRIRLLYYNGGAINFPKQRSIIHREDVYKLVNFNSLDGLIIISSVISEYVTNEEFADFCNNYKKLPIISIGIEVEECTSLVVDNYNGMRDLMIHLIEVHGYKQIAYIKGPEKNIESNIRFSAYKDVLIKYNIPINDKLILPGLFYGDSGRKAITMLLNERKVDFDAVVCSNDYMAIQVIEELGKRGIKVPDDVAVTGFDNSKEGRYLLNPLTTVNQPEFDLGYQAAKNMFLMLNGREVSNKIEFPTKLIVRDTCGCGSAPINGYKNIPSNLDYLKNSLVKMEEKLVPDVADILYTLFSDIIDKDLSYELSEKIISSIIESIEELKDDDFILILKNIASIVISNSNDSILWKEVITYILNIIQHNLFSKCKIDFVNNIRIKIKDIFDEAWKKYQEYPMLEKIEMDYEINQINRALLNVYDIETFKDIIYKEFPKIGITSCYLAIFKDEKDKKSEGLSRILFAYKNKKIIKYNKNEEIFPAKNLIPGGIKNLYNDKVHIITSLNHQSKAIGFVIIESDFSVSKSMCGNLMLQLAYTLKGVPSLLQNNLLTKINNNTSNTSHEKYQSYGLSKEKSNELYNKLLDYMINEKPYRNSGLMLSDLSKELEIPRTYLSYIINEYAGFNFFDFINKFRVEEAKRNLIIPNNMYKNILEIALISGFNSKSTFNKIFKKFTGKTPSDYKKEITSGTIT